MPLPASFNVAVQDAWLDQLQDSIDIHQLPPANDYMISAWLERFHDRFAATDIDLIMMTLPPVFSNHETGVAKNIQLSADDNENCLTWSEGFRMDVTKPLNKEWSPQFQKQSSLLPGYRFCQCQRHIQNSIAPERRQPIRLFAGNR